MTGRAAGFCAGYPAPGYMNPYGGRGFGRGGGRGWRRAFPAAQAFGGYGAPYAPYVPPAAPYLPPAAPFAPPYASAPAAGQELAGLKSQAEYLSSTLDAIKARMDELEKEKQSK